MIDDIEKKLYNNIAKKIKVLAIIVTIVLSIFSIIVGFVITGNQGFEYGWVCIFLYPPLIWISSFVLYGFGELVDKVTKIEQALSNTNKNASESEEKIAIEQSNDGNNDCDAEKGEVS